MGIFRRRLLLCTLAIISCSGSLLRAQQSWTNYTNTDAVYTVVDDGSSIWAGTGGGLVRYDITTGAATVITTADGLRGNQVNQVLLDRNGTLWANTDLGLCSYAAGQWKRHTFFLTGGDSAKLVMAMALDSSGHIVVAINEYAATNAIARYDGSGWHLIEIGTGLPANISIGSLMVDRTGSVWGTGVEYRSDVNATVALRITGDSVRIFRQEDGLPATTIYAVAADSAGAIWLAGATGISRFDGTTWKSFAPFVDPQGLRTSPMAIAVDAAGSLWVGGLQGLDRYDGAAWRHFTTADGLPVNVIRQVVTDGSTIWAGSGTAVSRYLGGQWTVYNAASGLPAGSSVGMLGRGAKGMLVATSEGVARFDGESWRVYDRTNSIHSNAVTGVALGANDTLWAIFNAGGLDRFDGTTWRHFSAKEGVVSDTLYTIIQGRSGEIWISGLGGIGRYRGGAWSSFVPADSLKSMRFGALAVDSSGGVWTAGSNNRVYRFDGESWTSYTGPSAGNTFGFSIGAICVDPSGNVWVASAIPPVGSDGVTTDGLYRFNGTSWSSYHLDAGWPTTSGVNPPRAMASDRNGALWLAFDELVEGGKMFVGGIGRFDGTTWKHYRSRFEIPRLGVDPDQPRSISLDSTGAVWCGAYGAGAIRFDGTNWTQYLEENGLASSQVQSIVFAHDGSAWLGTSGGVSRLGNAVVAAAVPGHAVPAGGELSVAPNPLLPNAGEQGMVSFMPLRSGAARLTLRDALGREVSVVFDGRAEAGRRMLRQLDVAGLAAGVYYLQLESDGAIRSERFLLVR